jgi:hypothetical protein
MIAPAHGIKSAPKESTMSTDKKSKKLPTAKEYRDAGKRLYHVDGATEIDDKARVSRESTEREEGAYVQAWVWVPRQAVDKGYDPDPAPTAKAE